MKRLFAGVLALLLVSALFVSCNLQSTGYNNTDNQSGADGYYRIEVPMIQTADLSQ
jgi:hypothetical protein